MESSRDDLSFRIVDYFAGLYVIKDHMNAGFVAVIFNPMCQAIIDFPQLASGHVHGRIAYAKHAFVICNDRQMDAMASQ